MSKTDVDFTAEELEAVRKYHKTRYEQNKEKVLQYQKNYRESNPLRYARQMLKTWQKKVEKLEAEERAKQQEGDADAGNI